MHASQVLTVFENRNLMWSFCGAIIETLRWLERTFGLDKMLEVFDVKL
jgi:hypothetical protein